MSSPIIETFLFDDENEEKIGHHGLTLDGVAQILDNIHLVIPNRKKRKGLYLIIGRDNGGSYITVPIESTNILGLWRPITAWPSKKGEITLLSKKDG